VSQETIRAGFDTWAGHAKPSLAHPREGVLQLNSNSPYECEAFLWFKNPAPRGATITSATLTLRAKGASSGSRTITAQRVTQKWTESRLTYNGRPSATSTGQATAAIGTLADTDSITLNVTTIVQAWANSASNFGFKVTTSATTMHRLYSLNSAYKPTLTVVWSDAPSKPTNLRPSAASTSLAKPHLVFDYLDVSGDTSLAAVQVQIDDASDFATPIFDSGTVATTSAGLDLASTAFAGLTDGQTVYWRVRAQDGAGLWSAWSDVVSMTRKVKPALAITNLGGGVVYDPTPPILWSMTGQARYQVLVYKTSNLTKAIHDSGQRTGTDTSYTIPAGILTDGVSYTVEVRGWDAPTPSREATPGDPNYASAQALFSLATDSSTGPVATLTAAPVDLTPWVDLTFTRSTTPDSFVLLRQDAGSSTWKVVRSEILPSDVFVSGTTYRLRYYGARPNRETSYAVRAVVNNKQSANGPTATLTTSPSGLWIVDFDRGIYVTLWGNDEGTWSMVDDASVYAPVGSTEVIRIVNGMRGLEGSLSGLLMDGFGKTFDQMESDLYAIKSEPTQTVRIIAGDENFTALVGNLRISPKPETRQGHIVKAVSFDFWQVGDLPFDTP
jgi:hypothetical protein